MLRHIGLAAVALALVTLTADTVHGRGGMRSGRSGSGSAHGFYIPSYYYPSAGTHVSSHARSSSATATGKTSHTNAVAGEQTVPMPPTTSTLGGGIASGTSAQQTTKPATTPPTNAVAPVQSPAQTTVTNGPLVLPSYTIPLDPNTAAQSSYGALLRNAKQLIRAGIYGPAATYLQRIINGAPGTRIAAEAQRLLARLPTI